jgi:hypothetical protein
MRIRSVAHAAVVAAIGAAAAPAATHEIVAATGNAAAAPFDIVRTEVAAEGGEVVFRMAVSGEAGASRPTPSGRLAGSTVHSYVWPTSLDSAAVGFEAGQGILAFAVTSHPDFDDTPRRDENGDGRADNDGDLWHSHWVVLTRDEACGPAALKVRDIPEGAKPRLPETWPGLPLLIDSPDYPPALHGDTVDVRVPVARLGDVEGVSFDGVTAGLRVNASVHAPLLCVSDVFDIASSDLSLPGKVRRRGG